MYISGACIRYTYDTLVHLQQIRILGGSTADNRRLQQILVSQQHILVDLFDEMSIMNSMSNLFDVEIGNRSRDGCGATLG